MCLRIKITKTKFQARKQQSPVTALEFNPETCKNLHFFSLIRRMTAQHESLPATKLVSENTHSPTECVQRFDS